MFFFFFYLNKGRPLEHCIGFITRDSVSHLAAHHKILQQQQQKAGSEGAGGMASKLLQWPLYCAFTYFAQVNAQSLSRLKLLKDPAVIQTHSLAIGSPKPLPLITSSHQATRWWIMLVHLAKLFHRPEGHHKVVLLCYSIAYICVLPVTLPHNSGRLNLPFTTADPKRVFFSF